MHNLPSLITSLIHFLEIRFLYSYWSELGLQMAPQNRVGVKKSTNWPVYFEWAVYEIYDIDHSGHKDILTTINSQLKKWRQRRGNILVGHKDILTKLIF